MIDKAYLKSIRCPKRCVVWSRYLNTGNCYVSYKESCCHLHKVQHVMLLSNHDSLRDTKFLRKFDW